MRTKNEVLLVKAMHIGYFTVGTESGAKKISNTMYSKVLLAKKT